MRLLILLASVLTLLRPTPTAADEDRVMHALRDELARSVGSLKMEGLDRPYFIAYTVSEEAVSWANASFGAILNSNDTLGRSLAVEVRVGDRTLDNTGYVVPGGVGAGAVRFFGGSVPFPL